MDNIKQKNFVNSKTLNVYYIFGTTRNEDETINEVLYFVVNKDKQIFWGHIDSQKLASKILQTEVLAYAGEEGKDNDGRCIKNPSLVVLATNENRLILKTANDPDEDNNLLSLPIYEIYFDVHKIERYKEKK